MGFLTTFEVQAGDASGNHYTVIEEIDAVPATNIRSYLDKYMVEHYHASYTHTVNFRLKCWIAYYYLSDDAHGNERLRVVQSSKPI